MARKRTRTKVTQGRILCSFSLCFNSKHSLEECDRGRRGSGVCACDEDVCLVVVVVRTGRGGRIRNHLQSDTRRLTAS